VDSNYWRKNNMGNIEIAKNTTIRLLEDVSSLDLDYAMISSGTLGKIEDFEINPHTKEIIGYYATIYWTYEEYLYLDPWEFDVIDEWEEGYFNLQLVKGYIKTLFLRMSSRFSSATQ
jgi:hypothetical protein